MMIPPTEQSDLPPLSRSRWGKLNDNPSQIAFGLKQTLIFPITHYPLRDEFSELL